MGVFFIILTSILFIMTHELSIWTKKILILIGFTALFFILYKIRSIVFILIISGFLTIILNPLVTFGEKKKVPAWITLIAVYIIVIILWSIVIGTLIPIIVTYVTDTINTIILWVNNAKSLYVKEWIEWFHFHPYIERAILLLFWEKNIDHILDIIKQNAGNIQSFLTTQISSITSGGFTIMSQVGGVIADWTLIGISTFLMVLERKTIGNELMSIIPTAARKYVANHFLQIQHVFTTWMKAMLILSGSIFCITFIGLSIIEGIFWFSLGKTFTLALIGGIMEFIPYVGPIIALIPAVIIGLGISWKVAGIVTILYIIIQQIENNFLVPYVMSKNLDLSPYFVFIVMLIWASLGGVLGIILAVPMAAILKFGLHEYLKNSREKENTARENSAPSAWGKENVPSGKKKTMPLTTP